jgi:hypothetical protein
LAFLALDSVGVDSGRFTANFAVGEVGGEADVEGGLAGDAGAGNVVQEHIEAAVADALVHEVAEGGGTGDTGIAVVAGEAVGDAGGAGSYDIVVNTCNVGAGGIGSGARSIGKGEIGRVASVTCGDYSCSDCAFLTSKSAIIA